MEVCVDADGGVCRHRWGCVYMGDTLTGVCVCVCVDADGGVCACGNTLMLCVSLCADSDGRVCTPGGTVTGVTRGSYSGVSWGEEAAGG